MKKKILLVLIILIVIITVGIGIYWKYFKVDSDGYTFSEEGRIKYMDTSKIGKILILPKEAEGIIITEVNLNHYDIKKVDVTRATELTYLGLEANALKTIDVSRNTKLDDLTCSDNRLTALDVTKNMDLVSLYCAENQLSELDVSNNKKLKWLHCYGNKIKELDISNNPELVEVWVDKGTKVVGNHNAEISYYEYNEDTYMWEPVE